MSPPVLTRRALNRATLARQLLLEREAMPVAEAVARLGGLQAQEPKPPFVGLWTRVAGFEAEALTTALHERVVVRGTLMRGTLHLAAAEDLLVQRATLAPALRGAWEGMRARAKGIDPDAVVAKARPFAAKEPRTFDEIRDHLSAAFPELDHRMLGYATRMELPLVMVPTEDRWGFGRISRFALAEDWVDAKPPKRGDLPALVERYLAAFGPATAADFATWSGLRGADEVLRRRRDELAVFVDERGRELFDLPDAPRPDPDAGVPARFLPEFDNLLLAHDDRTRVIADEHRPLVTTKNLRVRATFLWDGFVRGTWQTERKRKVATLRLTPFAPLPKKALRPLEREGEALLAFLEPDATERAVVVEDA